MGLFIDIVLAISFASVIISALVLYIEDYLFFQILKKAGAKVSPSWLFSFGSTNWSYKVWKSKNPNLELVSEKRLKIRKMIKRSVLICIFLLFVMLVIKISTDSTLLAEIKNQQSYRTARLG